MILIKRQQKLWEEKILPLAREAWQVEQEHAEKVWDIAAKIIRILGLKTISDLDASVLAILRRLESLEGEKEADDGGTVSSPVIVITPDNLDSDEGEEAVDAEERKEIDGLPATNRDLNRPAPPAVGRWPEVEPQPYQEFEETVQGPLQHILHVLKPRPIPEDRYASEGVGRPVPRNILFTPETPFEESQSRSFRNEFPLRFE